MDRHTARLLNAVGRQQCDKGQVAALYREAMRTIGDTEPEWDRINGAIEARWGQEARQDIQRQASQTHALEERTTATQEARRRTRMGVRT